MPACKMYGPQAPLREDPHPTLQERVLALRKNNHHQHTGSQHPELAPPGTELGFQPNPPIGSLSHSLHNQSGAWQRASSPLSADCCGPRFTHGDLSGSGASSGPSQLWGTSVPGSGSPSSLLHHPSTVWLPDAGHICPLLAQLSPRPHPCPGGRGH